MTAGHLALPCVRRTRVYNVRYREHPEPPTRVPEESHGRIRRHAKNRPTPADAEARAACGHGPGGSRRARGAHHAQAGGHSARGTDGAVPARGEPGRPDRRDDRRGVQRDRGPVARRRLADGHATTRYLAPRRAPPSPLGDRADGVASPPRTSEPRPSRRRARQPPSLRLFAGTGSPRVFGARQLHLRLRLDEDEPPVRRVDGHERDGRPHARALPRRHLSPPGRVHQRPRDEAGLRLRQRVRVRSRPGPRGPRSGRRAPADLARGGQPRLRPAGTRRARSARPTRRYRRSARSCRPAASRRARWGPRTRACR